ncbi:MAG: TonB-dependent receptor [Bacteroidota bacterium]
MDPEPAPRRPVPRRTSRIARGLWSVVCGLCLALPASGQTDYAVTGRVVDADTEAPVVLASVAVWRVSARAGVEPFLETGAATEADGTFRVAGLSRGRYYAVVSFLGYESARTDTLRLNPRAPVADLGTIRLAPDAQALGGVEVAAERDRVEFQVDRTVYRIADDPLASGGSTSEALETIPSVEVDVDGNVSLRGNGNVVVLIDGRPAPVGRAFVGVYLQSLPADAVESVEVIPNPSARYEPEGSGGILNIVLKDDTELGLGGAVTLGGDSQGGYAATGLLTYGRGPLRLGATYGLRHSDREVDGDRFRINRFLDPQTTLDQETFDDRGRTSNILTLSADLEATPRTTFTANLQASTRAGAETETVSSRTLDGDGAMLSDYVRAADGESDGLNGSLRLGVRHDFEGVSQENESAGERPRGGRRGFGGGRGRRGGGGSRVALGTHALSVDLTVRASERTGDDAFTEAGVFAPDRTALEEQTTRDDGDLRATLQADYARPIGQTRLELGLQADAEQNETTLLVETRDPSTPFGFARDDGRTSAYDFDEAIVAGYLQLARDVGPLAVQAGVRGEVVRTTFAVGGEAFDNDYESLFPSASVAVPVGDDWLLRTSYSRRINRPRGRQLNPFPTFDDPLNVRVGNPNLRPEYTDAVEASLVRTTDWGIVSLTPFLRRTTDVVRRFQRVGADGVTTSTFENLDTATSTGLEAVLTYQPGGPLRGFLSLEGFRQSTDGSSVQDGLGAEAFGWGGRLNGTYSLGDRLGWGDLDLQSTVFYRAPIETEQGRVGERLFFDLALRQRLLDGRASLALRARDPFDLAGIEFVQDDALLYQEFSRSFGRQQVGLTFTYTFGNADRETRRPRPEAGVDDAGDGGLDF